MNKPFLPNDICRCFGLYCDRKNQCLRFLADSGSYTPFAQFDPKDCDSFIDVNTRSK